MAEQTARAVIDRFEGDYAVVAFDDGQQLDWPRSGLPAAVQPGVAVVVRLAPAGAVEPGPGADAEAGSPAAGQTEAGSQAAGQTAAGQAAGQTAAGWQGEVTAHPSGSGWLVQLAGGQQLHWPHASELAASPGAPVSLQLTPDLEDTHARRRRVTSLLDDIFGNPA